MALGDKEKWEKAEERLKGGKVRGNETRAEGEGKDEGY